MAKFLKILICSALSLAYGIAVLAQNQGSVLATGKWFKIAVTADGIYRIDFSRLRQLGLDNPSYPRIYAGNNGQLPYYNVPGITDDLKEIPVFISGNDELLNEGEYLLFFARGTGRWKYDYEKRDYSYLSHDYSDTAFYFITSGTITGKRIETALAPDQDPSRFSSVSDALFIYENNQDNLIKSGREWFQRITSITIDPGFTDLEISSGIGYELRVAARSSSPSFFMLSENSVEEKSVPVNQVNIYDNTGTYAQIADTSGRLELISGSPVFKVRFDNKGEAGASGWLDYLKLKTRRSNFFRGNTTLFFDSGTVMEGGVSGFSINSSVASTVIWDVTDDYYVKNIQYQKTGDDIRFRFPADSLRQFVVFTADKALKPVIRESPVKNQDLHSSAPAEMIIVTHPLFLGYAERLADIHASESGMVSLIVTPEQIYNEYSGGIPDICAIRNFVRMKYLAQKGTGNPLKYLLLLGDGSYENRTPPPGNPNFVPTYQSKNSINFISSFISDDFYGLLEDGEGEAEGTEDIGIGRIPVSDTVGAGIVLSKIERYMGSSSHGDWRTRVCLTADDEDGNSHMIDAEALASLLQDSVPFINTDKIYLDAYKQQTTASGQSYPDVNRAINDRINDGCLIFNYIGHGSEIGLAHERILDADDIASWKNKYRLPLFITATCEFSRFDDMDINVISHQMTERKSAGEKVLLSPDGGGIALMSTTRLVYAAPNYTLNRNILGCAFERDDQGEALRLGDIIRIAKNRTGNGPNKRNFTLLGDPALRLAFPWHGTVITDSINHLPVTGETDTLKALSVINVSGHVEYTDGGLMNSFNGVVSPLVFDKEKRTRTLANDGGEVMEFGQWKSILFSGRTMAKNGKFNFSFIVPRDIDYSYGTGKINYYASDSSTDMAGYFGDLMVGGFSGSGPADNTGPVIRLYMNDTLFRNGGITDPAPRLLAFLEDKDGINTSGSSIGHDLVAFLDGERNAPVILNGYFENDFDDYTKGSVNYDLGPLRDGSHTLTLRAWDNFNNSAQGSIDFLVEPAGKFMLRNLICYPNPFSSETRISAEHNRPGELLDITINIFSLDGRLINIISTKTVSAGYVIPPVLWDGAINGGQKAGSGIYPFSVTVKTSQGEVAHSFGRLIII